MTLVAGVDLGGLWLLLVAVSGVATVVVLLLFGVTARQQRQRQDRAVSRQRWLATLTPSFEQGHQRAQAVPAPVGMSVRHQITTVLRLAGQLAGGSSQQIYDNAVAVTMTTAAQEWTTSTLWWRRLRGVRTLVLLGIPATGLTALVNDPHPEVRAEMAAFLSIRPDASAIHQLIRLLSDPVAQCRFAAEDGLLSAGSVATAPIARALAREHTPELPALLRVATRIASARLLPAGLRHSHDDQPAIRVAAAGLLAAIGGEQASERLVASLCDTDAGVRAAAAEGLGALAHWPAATLLVQQLADDSFDVRRAAGGALRALGSVGKLYLRRAAAGSEARAAQMAQHILDLPDLALGVRAA